MFVSTDKRIGGETMTNYIYIATSLDGFIATIDGGIDWLNEIPNPEQSDYGWAEFMSGIDAIVMGRNTFEKVLTFGSWPYDKPVFVLSGSLPKIQKAVVGKAEIVNGDLHELIKGWNERGYNNIYIDGGRTIQSFLKEDLVDEMIITKIPILLGDGIPLFGKLPQSMKFIHNKTEIYNNSLVMSHYTRDR
jgi:dihydrofolate reductase